MKEIKNIFIPVALSISCFCASMMVCSAEDQVSEVRSLGMKYTLTQEMIDAGLQTFENGINPINEIGELDVCCKDVLLGAVLVMTEEQFQNYGEEQTATEVFASYYPDYSISSTQNGGYEYVYLDCYNAIAFDELESDIADSIRACQSLYGEFITNISYITVIPDSMTGEKLTFDSQNIDGEQVTDAVLAEKDYTIINVWATYCNPCISEMPDLAKWEAELPDNVQIFYLCADITSEDSEEMKTAQSIAEESGISRDKILILTSGNFSQLVPYMSAVPTTFFVDKEGTISDQIVVGANIEKYKETLKSLLE